MTSQIDAILFDMGGTLRRNTKRDETTKAEIIQQILDLLKSDRSALEFSKLLTTRERAYDAWASGKLVELNEFDLWTQWMLPDWPAEIVRPMSMKFNGIWRDAICTRAMFPETRSTILELHQRGYILGLVSNTTSSIDSPGALEKEGISDLFSTMILSCVQGERKPAPGMLLEAAKNIGILPKSCAYIGDRPDWDVVAARAAGFGVTVVLPNPKRPMPDPLTPNQTPDHFISNLIELLDIFPAKNK